MSTPESNPATSPAFQVLLVEDDFDLGETLQTALAPDQIALTLARNGREAL